VNERRSKLAIFVDIIRVIRRRGGMAKPTHILYGANLSHKRLNQYLGWMIEQGLIEMSEYHGGKLYKVTPKGDNFMKEFKKIEEFSEAFGIGA